MINDESIEGNTGWTIKSGQNVILDLNGYSVKNLATSSSGSAVLTNKGTLTIKDATDINKDGTGTGCLMNDAAAGVTAGNYWAGGNYITDVISNSGTLIIDSGKIMNTCKGSICYCIDNFATCIINGGWLYNKYTCAIRVGLYNGGGNVLTVNGGTIEGNNAIWVQNPSTGSAPSGTITLNGGVYKTTDDDFTDNNANVYDVGTCIYNTGSESSGYNPSNIYFYINGGEFYENIYVCGTKSHCSITGGTFHGYVTIASNDRSITGGTFANPHIVEEAGWVYYWYTYRSGAVSTFETYVKDDKMTDFDTFVNLTESEQKEYGWYFVRADYKGSECYKIYYWRNANEYDLFDTSYLASGYTTTPSSLTGYVDVIVNTSTND